MSRDIGAEHRATLRALADVLVPAGGTMPSGSAAGVAEAGIDHVLNVRPDIFADLLRALRLAGGLEPAQAPAIIAGRDGAAWQALRFAILGAYFTSPSVRKAIGYAGQPAMPFDPDAEPEYLDSLARVVARGRV